MEIISALEYPKFQLKKKKKEEDEQNSTYFLSQAWSGWTEMYGQQITVCIILWRKLDSCAFGSLWSLWEPTKWATDVHW